MKYRIDEIYDLTKNLDGMKEFLVATPTITIQIPFEGYQRTARDIMIDYISVSQLAEGIANCGSVLGGKAFFGNGFGGSFTVTLTDYNLEKFSEFLLLYSYVYSDEDYYGSDEHHAYIEELADYEYKLEKRTYHFPEILDRYYANLVNQGYFEIYNEIEDADGEDEAVEFLRKEHKKYPERYFKYWRSAYSDDINLNVYVSKDAWIIPNKYDYKNVLIKLGEAKDTTEFIKASINKIENKQLICNDETAVWNNMKKELETARDCAKIALKQYKKLTFEITETEYYLSKYADILIIRDTFFTFVFFLHDAKLRTNEIKEIRSKLNPLHSILGNVIGAKNHYNIDWTQVDDEQFEHLCYDIIYDHPKFDERTIRKMGKSRSRDGGRDITVMTKSINASDPELHIFQCKLLSVSSSLTRTKVNDAANVILHYDAKGYGVFTNVLIDSTLYDMLDGFTNSIEIHTRENWGKLELEKLLNDNDYLRNKYFKF
tara:strand:- start:7315 stop:8775 length:1461 start_codon:yes stop_codon:yes gene_type:complete